MTVARSWQESCRPENGAALREPLANFPAYVTPHRQSCHNPESRNQRIFDGSCAERSDGQTKRNLASGLLSDRLLYETAIWTQYFHKFSSTSPLLELYFTLAVNLM
jgi:hypothetical protein